MDYGRAVGWLCAASRPLAASGVEGSRITRLALWIVLTGVVLTVVAAPAVATEGFAYEWKSNHVFVRWTEGNEGPLDAAVRRQVGHWKRLAETLWQQIPGAPPLRMEVSLYGPSMGSDEPALTLVSGDRQATVEPPFTEERVFAALITVRDGRPPAEGAIPPADDAYPRIAPNGAWVSVVSWRGGNGPEVWIIARDGSSAVRVPPIDPEAPLLQRLVQDPPRWSTTRQELTWVQGGRVYHLDMAQRQVRILTPADAGANRLSWAPSASRPLLVEYDEGRFELLDLMRSRAIPLYQVLEKEAARGPFLWSADGSALMFRMQSRLETASWSVGSVGGGVWERVRGLFGFGSGSQSVQGAYEERLALLDLASGRLDAVSLAEAPLRHAEIVGALWNRSDGLVYVVARNRTGESTVTRVRWEPRTSANPDEERWREVLISAEPIWPLGWRTQAGKGVTEQFEAEAVRAAFVQGNEIVLLDPRDGDRALSPYSASGLIVVLGAPGPDGGYLGAEGEALETESEPAQTVWLEDIAHTQGSPVRTRLPGGIQVTLPLVSPVVLPLQVMAQQGAAMDVDIVPTTDALMVAVMGSNHGGVGQIVTITPRAEQPDDHLQLPISLLASQDSARITTLTAADQPLPTAELQEGISQLAADSQSTNPSAVVPALLAVLAFLLGAWLFKRREARRKSSPD